MSIAVCLKTPFKGKISHIINRPAKKGYFKQKPIIPPPTPKKKRMEKQTIILA